jgi:transcriptional regulator with XRE-family HTH domain
MSQRKGCWGRTLRLERLKRGLSQEEVAAALGTNDRTVRAWEKQEQFPIFYYRRGLSRLYGKTIEALGLLEED